MSMAQLHRYGTVTWYSTIVWVWLNYMGVAQLHGYGTIMRVWYSYKGMAQLHGIAQLYGYGTITGQMKRSTSNLTSQLAQ